MSNAAAGTAPVDGPPPAAAPAPPADGRPRVLLYSHDGFGLGHIRVTLTVAAALAERRSEAALLVVTGSLQTHAFDLPPNLDYVKVPAIDKRHLYAGLPPFDRGPAPLRGVLAARAALIRSTAAAFAPRLLVVDHAAAGPYGELMPTLRLLRGGDERVEMVLLLRDITYDPAETRARWQEEGVYDLLEQVYDRILVYGSPEVFDPIREYGLSPAVAAKTTFCGYLGPPPPTLPPGVVRARLGATDAPLAVVTVGGGGDGAALIRAYLDAVRGGRPAGLVSYVVTGPMMGAAERAELEAAAVGVPGVTLVPFCADLVDYLRAADVVVTMGGYNAVCEAVGVGKRPVVVPRSPGAGEQEIRARRFADLGLVTMLHPSDLGPDRLRRAVETELERGTTPPRRLDFGGAERIGDILAAALGR